MNAYKLADRLQIAQGNNNVQDLIPETIDMLRSQEVEIERINAKHEEVVRQQQAEIGCYKLELELHKAMIQDLEKQLDESEQRYWNNK